MSGRNHLDNVHEGAYRIVLINEKKKKNLRRLDEAKQSKTMHIGGLRGGADRGSGPSWKFTSRDGSLRNTGMDPLEKQLFAKIE